MDAVNEQGPCPDQSWEAFCEVMRWADLPLAELESRSAAGDLNEARLKTAWRIVRSMPQHRARWKQQEMDSVFMTIQTCEGMVPVDVDAKAAEDRQEAISMARRAVEHSGTTLEVLRAEAADERRFSSARNRMAWMVIDDFLGLGDSDQV